MSSKECSRQKELYMQRSCVRRKHKRSKKKALEQRARAHVSNMRLERKKG